MTAATIESQEIWSKSGIWEKIISITPKAIIYGVLETLQGFFPPLSWKQLDLFTALFKFNHNQTNPIRPKTSVINLRQCLELGSQKYIYIYIYIYLYIITYIMLMEAAIVYPIATPTRLKYWITPQIVTLKPPERINNNKNRVHQLKLYK